MAWTESSSEDRVSFSYEGPGREITEVVHRGSSAPRMVMTAALLFLSAALLRVHSGLALLVLGATIAGSVWAMRFQRSRVKRRTNDYFVITISSSSLVVTSIQGVNRVISIEHVLSFIGNTALRVAMRDGSQQILPPALDEPDYAPLADAMNLALRRIQSQRAGYRGPLM